MKFHAQIRDADSKPRRGDTFVAQDEKRILGYKLSTKICFGGIFGFRIHFSKPFVSAKMMIKQFSITLFIKGL